MAPKAFIVVVALLLAACGYHLRGAVDLPDSLKKVYLNGASMQLREQFRKVLRGVSGELTTSPEAAGVVINVANEISDQRVLSLSARGRSNELELYYRLQYTLVKADGVVVLEGLPVEIKREYFNNQQDIVAKDNEQQVIRNEMLQQAVRIMLDRIRLSLATDKK
ncbi:LPS assembly lipoprotein LptE [Methylovulum psychrotolerans]|jgi:LPS-assembly lipoprotein|uniref:LPS-assembly lipoprotein LptE n=1 Tax=Methylovulum psychrotolerans TaxID=1704499 RepID=A0A2S5CLD5_9GAMM|nr:LPS assembly lipoprotein LptE [Methylovulum psychrotolerans]POZ51629.1 LPS-assembly lipoprotein LptE [Methylovulum psychrotolerans]